jgi:DNA ligase (NAD+)
MDSVEVIVKRLLDAKHAYYNTVPIMSDMDYDALELELRDIDPTNSFFSIVGPLELVGGSANKRKHKIPMGSQYKVKIDDGGVGKIISNFLREHTCMVSYKLDGISVSVEYVDGVFKRALTRGDGITGEIIPDALDITHILPICPHNFTGALRGEIIMTYSDFALVNLELEDSGLDVFSNPRNAVSGIARKVSTPYRNNLMVLYYDVETEEQFETKYEKFVYIEHLVGSESVVPYFAYTHVESEKFKEFCYHMDKTRKDLEYMIDGLVVEINDIDEYKSKGIIDNKPKGSIALKFNAVAETTYMRDIVWQVGSTGSLTPVAEFEPVLIDGSIVSRASIHNYDIFKEWSFAYGDEILVQKNNDIIPQIKELVNQNIENLEFEAPRECPECGSELELIKVAKTTNLTCTNPMCIAKKVASVKKWANKTGMSSKGVGDAFFKSYIDSVDDSDIIVGLYELSITDIMNLSDRYKEKSATNIYNAIQSSKDVELVDFFGGLNIHGCGSRTFKKIVDASNIDTSSSVIDFYNFCIDNDISEIDGIGEITSKLIKSSLPELYSRIQLLLKHTHIIHKVETCENGKSFLFTGSFNTIDPNTGKGYKRKGLEALVRSKGYTVASLVNKSLDYLVTSDPESTSSKMVKARKLDIVILGEDEFFGMM